MGNIFHQCPKGKDISGKKEANFSRTIITNFGSVVDHEKDEYYGRRISKSRFGYSSPQTKFCGWA